MKPQTLSVLAGFLAYGGNGGVATLLPEIMFWWAKVCSEMEKDERINCIRAKKFGDVPLTMERNKMVRTAKDLGCDVLLMIDSDNIPDLYEGVLPEAKPFWKTSFDFLYERKIRGLPTVVAAPYCGPPPHPTKGGIENVYVFHPEVLEGDVDKQIFKLEGYSREHAAQLRGIQPMAAGPTGCILYSMDAFDVMPVHSFTQADILDMYKRGEISNQRACRLLNMQSWFFYEYTNGEQTEKASTDDVTNTREIQLAGILKYKEPIVFCNWDAWAGHAKPKIVGKPLPIFVEQVNELYREAVEKNASCHDRLDYVDYGTEGGPVLPCDEQEDVPKLQVAEGPTLGSNPAEVEDIAGLTQQPQVQWSKRMIYGRPVMSVGGFGGGQTPENDLNALGELVHFVAASRPKQPLRIVEIGSWVGESAIAMHQGFGPFGGTVFCVDTWEGSLTDMSSVIAKEVGFEKLFDVFKDNVGDLLDKSIKVFRGESVQVASEFEDPQNVDMVFIDADHSYNSVKADIQAWLRHVAPTGIIAGHDWTDGFPGVAKAVKEICDSVGIVPRVVNNSTVWFFPMAEYLAGKQQCELSAVPPTKAPRKKKATKRGRPALSRA